MADHAEKSEKIKKPIYKKWWFWLIIVIAVIGIASSSSDTQTPTKTTSSGSVATSTTQEPVKDFYEIGEAAVLGSGSITVTDVEKSSGTSFDKPKSGKEFVIVHVTIKNIGNSNLSYNPFYFKVQNSQGQQTDITFTIVDSSTSLEAGDLVPGGSVSGTITFEEPIDDPDLVLIYQDNFWSNKTLKIKLQ